MGKSSQAVPIRCCGTCVYLEVPENSKGEVKPDPYKLYPCRAPRSEKPVTPDSEILNWPPRRFKIGVRFGTGCPMHVFRQEPSKQAKKAKK